MGECKLWDGIFAAGYPTQLPYGVGMGQKNRCFQGQHRKCLSLGIPTAPRCHLSVPPRCTSLRRTDLWPRISVEGNEPLTRIHHHREYLSAIFQIRFLLPQLRLFLLPLGSRIQCQLIHPLIFKEPGKLINSHIIQAA